MPSKATKKPTGPCSACQKQGALLRCVPCRDAGVDIFFCNRECQAKLWKQHKAFCGKVLTTSPNLENIQNRKDAKVVQKAFRAHNRHSASCQNCSKNGTEVGHELSLCSKCKRAAYCSRECQVAHWPNHREFCRQRCAELKKWGESLSSKDKNIRSLLDDWRMLSTSIMGNAMEFCLTEEEVKQQPPTKMIWVHIQFNYNLRTFMLVQEPQALKISELRQAEQDRVRDSYKRNIQMLRGKSDRAFIQFLFLSCRDLEKGFLSLDPLIFYQHELHLRRFKDKAILRSIDPSLHLKSDLFQGWDKVRVRNLKQQIDYLKGSRAYSGFVENALKLFCTHSKQKDARGIMVHMKMGKEIGQIIHFDSYEDMSISKFKELSKKIKCFAPKQYRELVNDLNNSNVPQQSSAEMKVLICFVDTETMSGFYFDSNSVALNGFGKSASLKKRYKKDADECFSQLQVLVKFMPQNIVEKVSL